MKILVDADACPVVIKDILFRAAERTQIELTLYANHAIRVPPSKWISFRRVPAGFDIADHEIVKATEKGDLVVTQDIPLASELIEKGAAVITPRGERLTEQNIRQRLNVRDFMDTLRASGVQTGGPAALSQSDRREFANQLDRYLVACR